MSSLIIKTKFIPPTINKDLWHKEGLWKEYKNSKLYPLTVIKAGPGYGKSTTLASFFSEVYPKNYFWYSIDELDADPALFFLNFIHAFKYKNEEIGDESIKLLIQSGEKAVSIKKVLDMFINELLIKLNEDSFLILDDFNQATVNNRLMELMAYFIKMMPPKLHLILSTRERLNFKEWAEWRIKQKVLLIGEDKLSLNQREIIDFFHSQFDHRLNKEEALRIEQETEGWIMALDLIGQTLKNGAELNNFFSKRTNSLTLLFEYLAHEVLENQSKFVKEFLLKTSILKYLRVDICNRLLGIDDSKKILEGLTRKGLFVYRLADGQYRYHHLFQEFLKKQSFNIYDHINLHKKVAGICLDLGEKGFAIYHSLGAKDFEQAAKLILASADKLMELGRFDTLQSGLNELPEEVFIKFPLLYLYQGDIYRMRSQFNDALDAYKKAEIFFQKNKLYLSHTLQKIAMVYLDTVQPVKADHYLKQALKLRDQENLWEEATLLKMMAENKANEGHLKEAVKLQKKADKITNSEIASNNLWARVKLRTGRLDDAQEILEDKVNNEKELGRIPRSHRETALILSLIHSFKGEPNQALNYAQGGVYLGKQLKSPFIEAVAYMRLGHAYQLSGRYKLVKARNAYFKALELVDELKITRGRAEPLLGLSLLEAFHGDSNLGKKYGNEGLKISNQSGDEWLAGVIKVGIGINYYFSNDYTMAEKIMHEASENFINSNDKFGLSVCKLWLGLVYFNSTNWSRFKSVIEELYEISEDGNYDFLFIKPNFLGVRDTNLFAPILLESRKQGIKKEYVSGLIAELGLSEVKNHPGYSLRINSFGNFRVWRGQEEITNKEWKREKAKELFLLLLVHRGEFLPKERIYYLLWADEDDKTASRNFKVALNALKKALEPYRKPRQAPYFIKRRGSNYGFNEKAGYFFDAEEFEELIAYGNNEADIDNQMEYYHSAIELYKGDFLADNLYLDWIREERERLRNLFLNTASKLVEYYYKEKKYDETIKICNKILNIDSCWEQAYLYKMKSYIKLNRRSMAIKTFNKCKETLANELNVEPTIEIMKYYQKIIS